ncbi:ribonuclease P protein subunit [Candidatus Woesearchaeota archaeon]|nr:ribonuclease P protein subunit [Candidatus Woesearchaeota archaeon]
MTRMKLSIGERLKVIQSNHLGFEGLQGEVVAESKNTFTIRCQVNSKERTIKILKSGSVFDISGRKFVGDEILKRPEERLKQRK